MTYNPAEDAPHVMLDALNLLRRTIDTDETATPWEGYESAFGQVSTDDEATDVPPSRENYLAALDAAERIAEAKLNRGSYE